jgi:hypothetical protein
MGNGALPHGPSYRAHPRLYLSSPERVHRNVRSRRKQTFVQKIAYACVDITNCLEDAWLRLRFAEIVSQIIASDNAIGGLNPSRPIPFSV